MFSQQVMRVPFQDDRGAVLVEFAALVVLVAVMAIVALTAFGISVLDLHADNADRFATAVERNVG